MKYVVALLLIVAGVQGYFMRKIWNFAKQTAIWSEFKQQEIKCLNDRISYDNNSIFLLKVHSTRAAQRKYFQKVGVSDWDSNWIYKEEHGGYEDWIPSCQTFYTEFACLYFDLKNDNSIEKCASHWGFSEEEKIKLKKTRKYFEPEKYSKKETKK